MANTYFNQFIRRHVIGFGDLFNNITLVRYNPDGTEQERFIVPIQYAPKELYVQRLLADPDLEKKVRITLPRMSFENTGMSYDTSRKQNTNIKNFSQTSGSLMSQYNPVPYDFDFSLYLYTRTIADATQLVEHIVPYFTPDYTIKLNLVPEMGIVKEVPIILKNVSREISYEGDRDSETRLIIWTLDFTVKGFIFGASSQSSIISGVAITNVLNYNPSALIQFNMNPSSGVGSYQVGETVYQGYRFDSATATGVVANWANNVLTLTNTTGSFISTSKIVGSKSQANYLYTSYNAPSGKFFTANNVVYPPGANAASPYIANTTISEYGF
jgi:hypothetical protein